MFTTEMTISTCWSRNSSMFQNIATVSKMMPCSLYLYQFVLGVLFAAKMDSEFTALAYTHHWQYAMS